jgi:hypothetical protein
MAAKGVAPIFQANVTHVYGAQACVVSFQQSSVETTLASGIHLSGEVLFSTKTV